jgi:hypothetical protein
MGSGTAGSAAIGAGRKDASRIIGTNGISRKIMSGISRAVVPRRADSNEACDERSVRVGAPGAPDVRWGSGQGAVGGKTPRAVESAGSHEGSAGMPTGGGRGAR